MSSHPLRALAPLALLTTFVPGLAAAQGALAYRCGPDCTTPGRYVLCGDSFDDTGGVSGGLELSNFLDAACVGFTAPSSDFDLVGFAALFGPGDMVITLVELFPESGMAAPGGGALYDTGAGIPASGSAGFSGLTFDPQTLGADFRLCLRQQLDDPAGTIGIRPLLVDDDGVQGRSTTFIPGTGWQAATTGDFVLRAIIDRGDPSPWAPGGRCDQPDAGPVSDGGSSGSSDAGTMSTDDAGTTGADAGTAMGADAGPSGQEPPAITAVSPDRGANTATTSVVVTGAGFVSGLVLRIGTIAAEDVRVPGPTTILATVPANIAGGTYDVLVTNPDGQSAILKDGFTVVGPTGVSGLENKCTCVAAAARPDPRAPACFALGLAALTFARRRARR